MYEPIFRALHPRRSIHRLPNLDSRDHLLQHRNDRLHPGRRRLYSHPRLLLSRTSTNVPRRVLLTYRSSDADDTHAAKVVYSLTE
jgi:hypothetical protein